MHTTVVKGHKPGVRKGTKILLQVVDEVDALQKKENGVCKFMKIKYHQEIIYCTEHFHLRDGH